MKESIKETATVWVILLIPFVISQLFSSNPITLDETRLGFMVLASLTGLNLWSGWRKHPLARAKFYATLFILGGMILFVYLLLRVFFEVKASLILSGMVLLFFLSFMFIESLIVHQKRTALNGYFKITNFILPRSVRLLTGQAEWQMHEGNYEAAIQHASDAILFSKTPLSAKSKDEDPAALALTRAHEIRRDAYLIMGPGEYALSDAHVLVQAYPDKGEHYIARGIAYLHSNNLNEARSNLMQGLSLPTLPRDRVVAKTHLGFIDYIQGNYEAAGQDYWRALRIKLHPQERREYMPLVYINIGLMALHTGDQKKALKAYKTAFKLAPHLPAVRAGLALLHGAEGELDKSEAMWRVLIQDHSYFMHPEAVIARHFRWSPRMAELLHQLQPYVQDDITKHLTLSQTNRLLEVTEPALPDESLTRNILRS